MWSIWYIRRFRSEEVADMKSIVITIQDRGGDKKLTYNGSSWTCSGENGDLFKKCPGMVFGSKLIRRRIVSPEAARDLDEFIFYAERLFKAVR